MTATKLQPYLNSRQNPPCRFFGAPTVTHAIGESTNGAFSLSEHLTLPVGLESPYHTHTREDEGAVDFAIFQTMEMIGRSAVEAEVSTL